MADVLPPSKTTAAISTDTPSALHHDAYSAERPGFLQRQWNLTKQIAGGAADRLSEDVINFGDHPIRSSVEIAGAGVVGAGLIAGGVEAGAATAAYMGVTALSTEMGALFGAGTAAALAGPAAAKVATQTAHDWKATAAARETVSDPTGHSSQEVSAAQQQVRQTLGGDALANAAIYGPLAAGAVGAEAFARTGKVTTPGEQVAAGKGTVEPTTTRTAEQTTAQTTARDTAQPTADKSPEATTPKSADSASPSTESGGEAVTRDAKGNITRGTGTNTFNIRYDESGQPQNVSYFDGGQRQALTPSGDHFVDSKGTEFHVNIDQKSGVTIQGDGNTVTFKADGTRSVDRYNGYEQTSVNNPLGSDVANIRSMKMPQGIQLEQEPLAGGQSRLTLTKDGKTFTSESGSPSQGWTFKDGGTLSGSNSGDSVVKLTNDGPGNPYEQKDIGLSISSADGKTRAEFGANGWERTSSTTAEASEKQTLDGQGRVVESEHKQGNLTLRYSRQGMPGTPDVTEVEMPGVTIRQSPTRGVHVIEGNESVPAQSVRDVSDPANQQRQGYEVKLINGDTRTYWTDGTKTGAKLPSDDIPPPVFGGT